MLLHDGSKYNYHFIVKVLAEEFDEFNAQEKIVYNLFSAIKKKLNQKK